MSQTCLRAAALLKRIYAPLHISRAGEGEDEVFRVADVWEEVRIADRGVAVVGGMAFGRACAVRWVCACAGPHGACAGVAG